MKRITGNFLTQPNQDFPADCETLDAIQESVSMAAILGNIAGDKAIIHGCEPEGAANRKPGYVFLRTRQYPEGEIIHWEGGAIAGGMYVKLESVAVNVLGVDYPKAYTVRSLAPGIGEENYSWADFKSISSNQELEQKAVDQGVRIDALAPPPLGIVQMWAGAVNKIPANYRLCDGSTLPISEYPELYAALGNLHGGEAGSSFALPNLSGQFVAGYNAIDADYNAVAKRGGAKAVTLTADQIPPHSHTLPIVPWGTRFTGGGKASQLDAGTSNTGNAGGGQAHENRPPYYVLAYVIRVK